jgi:hypothetical protein
MQEADTRNPGLRPGSRYQLFKGRSVTIRMTATAFISGTAAMVTPDRITQVQIARIGGCADSAARDRANRGARRRITGQRANGRATSRANHGAARQTITGTLTATGNQQGRRKSQYHCRAHIWLP